MHERINTIDYKCLGELNLFGEYTMTQLNTFVLWTDINITVFDQEFIWVIILGSQGPLASCKNILEIMLALISTLEIKLYVL